MYYKKIGINIPLFGISADVCKQLNLMINQVQNSCVDFRDNGNSQPHVTITMGSIDFENDLETVIQYVKNQVSNLNRSPMRFGKPYCETLTKRYVFSDVIFNDQMIQFRNQTAKYMNQLYETPARVSEIPHITLAAYDDIVDINDYINNINVVIPSCNIEAVDISLAGDKGVKSSIIERVWI